MDEACVMFHVIGYYADRQTFQCITVFVVEYHRVKCAAKLVPMETLNFILDYKLVVLSKIEKEDACLVVKVLLLFLQILCLTFSNE